MFSFLLKRVYNKLKQLPCVFCFCVFGHLSIAITSLGEERANLSVFVRLFDFFFFLSVSSSSWCLGKAAAFDCGTPWTFHLLKWLKTVQDRSFVFDICLIRYLITAGA